MTTQRALGTLSFLIAVVVFCSVFVFLRAFEYSNKKQKSKWKTNILRNWKEEKKERTDKQNKDNQKSRKWRNGTDVSDHVFLDFRSAPTTNFFFFFHIAQHLPVFFLPLPFVSLSWNTLQTSNKKIWSFENKLTDLFYFQLKIYVTYKWLHSVFIYIFKVPTFLELGL